MNDTSFLLQRTFSGPQNQLKSVTSMQSSLQQKSAAPVIKFIQSVSGIVDKPSSARLGCQNIKETSSSTMEANNNIDQESQSVAETSNSHSITKIPRTKTFVPMSEIEFQCIVLSYLQSIEITYEQIQSKINSATYEFSRNGNMDET